MFNSLTKKKIQKKKLSDKIRKYKSKITSKNNNSKLVNKKLSNRVIQKGGTDVFDSILGVFNLVLANYSGKTKKIKVNDIYPYLLKEIVPGILSKVAPAITFPGVLSSYPAIILTQWVGNSLILNPLKDKIKEPFNKFYNRMKYQIVKYEPERIPIKETWFMKIISLVNGLFNKVFKNRHSVVIVGGLSIFLYLQFFYPKENPYLLASKFLIGILTTSFFIEIFLADNLLQFCHSELKKDVESNQSGGKYSKEKYKGSGIDIVTSSLCSQKINDKITIMLLNLKQQINGISDNEKLLLQKKTKTGIFQKRQISSFKSFKLEIYKFITRDKEYGDGLDVVKSLGEFGKGFLESGASEIEKKEKVEKDKEKREEEMEEFFKKKMKESQDIRKEMDDDDFLNQYLTGGNIVSGLIHNIFLIIRSLCNILKYEVFAIKRFIIVCLNICLKLISKGYNGLRIFYIFLKKCFIPLTLLTIMLFLHLKFGKKIKQYLQSKISLKIM